MKAQQTQPITAYICSPYKGDTARNIAYARELVKEAIAWGFAPICPHLYLPQILDDDKPEEREQALLYVRAGVSLVRRYYKALGNDHRQAGAKDRVKQRGGCGSLFCLTKCATINRENSYTIKKE